MKTFAQFTPELAGLWEKAIARDTQHWPFFTYAWHNHWYQTLGANTRPLIVANDTGTALIPLTIDGDTVRMGGGEEVADYLDAVGAAADIPSLWNEVLDLLPSHGVHSLLLRNIPDLSPTWSFFSNIDGAAITQEDTTPVAQLPDTIDAYLGALGRKERHEWRRKTRRFETTYPETRFEPLPSPDLTSLLSLMRKNSDKDGFLTPQMERFFQTLPETDAPIFQFSLTRNGTRVAEVLTFVTDTALLLYNSGYDPDIEGSGWYLKTKIIEWAIGKRLGNVNFLQGAERYKYEMGGVDHPVYRITASLP